MNNPEYIIVDEFATLVEAVRIKLELTNLNYQFGYVTELNETLTQWTKSSAYAAKKYPLVWLEQPFTLKRGNSAAYYGTIESVRVFIIDQSKKSEKAKKRIDNVFKPVIYPIYREILKQININPVFMVQSFELIEHTFTDRYYWGEAQQSVLVDVIDCSIVTFKNLKVNNNLNCVPLGMLKS
jgi:hypothetical protein